MSKNPASSINSPPSKLLKTAASPPPPTRTSLQNELNTFHAHSNFTTPIKDSMTTVIIQNHHQKLVSFHQGNVASKVPTPNTQAFIYAAQHLVNVGSQSIVQDRGKLLNEIAQSYVTRGAKKHSVGDFIIHRPQAPALPSTLSHIQVKVPSVSGKTSQSTLYVSAQPNPLPSTFPTPGIHMFGGDLPSNSQGKRERKTG